MTLTVRYLDEAETRAMLNSGGAGVLAALGYNAPRPAALPESCPFATVPLPPLGDGPGHEIWACGESVSYGTQGDFSYAVAGDAMMAVASVPETPAVSLETLAREAYLRLFDFVDGSGHKMLLRVWNYIPAITADADGMERYRRFNIGRHEAFLARRGGIVRPPAASALGTQGGPIVIYLLAGTGAGTPIENPRQVSAYEYPAQYGPRSPAFSRAMLAAPQGETLFFVSGTASIIGHETRHAGNVTAQARETVINLRALLAEAKRAGAAPRLEEGRLKVYVRRAADRVAVQTVLAREFPAVATVMMLNADICRPDLLVEIEGFFPA